MKVTNVVYSDNLNIGKYKQLVSQARMLGAFRKRLWHEFGGLSACDLNDRLVRDSWVKQGFDIGVPAKAWKETLRDVFDDITMYREAAKVKVKNYIRSMSVDDEEKKRLYTLLKKNGYQSDPLLRRLMRKHFKHGKTRVDNQIIIPSDLVKINVFEHNGKPYIKVPSLVRGKPIRVPLNCTINYAPKSTTRLILRNGKVELHSFVEINKDKPCGDKIVGIDKGYTEVLMDSDGVSYGKGLGKELTKESEYRNTKHQRRNKLKAIARKKPHKRAAIERNNLGRTKLDKRKSTYEKKLKTIIYTGVNQLVDKAGTIACEDLTAVFASKHNFGKAFNRRMNNWVKGMIAQALETVSRRRGSTLHLVNAAYTSQMDSFNNGLLTGTRKGDKFYRENGEVVQADYNAARNVLARLDDQEIGRWTPFKQVKAILQARTDRYRLQPSNQDSSYTFRNEALTESELILVEKVKHFLTHL